MIARDTQRSKVYAFGRKYTTGSLSLDECEELVKWAYGIAWMGRIADGRGTRIATGSTHKVNLPLWSRNTATVLHEAAHGLTRTFCGYEVAHHGPEFVRVFIELLARAKVAPITQLRAEARATKIKVATDAACIPPTASYIKALGAAKARVNAAKAELQEAQTALSELRKKR